MKKLTLKQNKRVTFNEQEHTYTLDDGTALSGITGIIHEYLFPCMYDGVSSSVMEAARERGHEIHHELELFFKRFPVESLVRPETHAYIRLAQAKKLKQIAAEYLVSDNERIATCIDNVLQVGDKTVALVDYKTTSVLYTKYLQWQLSMEAFLFEAQTGIKVEKLYAVHLPKEKEAKLVDIERLPDEYVKSLIECYKNGDLVFDNPLNKLSDDTNELLEQYLQSELALIELEASVKYHKDIQAAIKERIKEQMEQESASKWENDNVTITRSKDSVRKTFKPDKMREIATAEVNAWLDENIDKCYSETQVKGNVTIKFK